MAKYGRSISVQNYCSDLTRWSARSLGDQTCSRRLSCCSSIWWSRV